MSSTYVKLRELQSQLVEEMRQEYYCDDLEPPPEAFGWDEARLRAYFESGGMEDEDGGVHANCSPASSQPSKSALQQESARACILCIGDSITQMGTLIGGSAALPAALMGMPEHGPGWTALLARDFNTARRADVINRGFGGYQTRWILADLEQKLLGLPSEPPVAITLMLGSNDHVLPTDPIHVPVDEYQSNLVKIVQLLGARYPKSPVLLMTPPPCDGAAVKDYFLKLSAKKADGSGRGEERLVPYLAAAKAAAKASGARLVDIHDRLKGTGDAWKGLVFDGLHLNGEGNLAVYEIMRDELKAVGVANSPEKLPMHRPDMLGRSMPSFFDDEGRMKTMMKMK